MTQQTQSMNTSLWTSVSIMLVVLGLFMLTYITIRLLPSPATPAHRRTCRNPGPVQLVQPPVHTPEDLSGYDHLLAQYEDNTPGEALQATHLDIDTCLATSCHEEDAALSEVHEEDAALSEVHEKDAALSEVHEEDAALSEVHEKDAALSEVLQEDAALSEVHEEDAALSEVHAQAEIMTTTGLGHDAAVMNSSSVDEQSMVASDETHCTTAVVDSDSMDCAQQGLCVEDKST